MFVYHKLHPDVLISVSRHEISRLCSRQLLNVFLSKGYFHSYEQSIMHGPTRGYTNTFTCFTKKLVRVILQPSVSRPGTHLGHATTIFAFLHVYIVVYRPLAGDEKLYQCFPWFSLIPEQMLSWYPNSALHCRLPVQPSQW
jgi:hypothetical protein